MDIKVATYDDYKQIAQLQANNWQLHYKGDWVTEMDFQQLLDDRLVIWQTRLINPALNQHVLLLHDQGKLCGFICAFGHHNFEKGTLIDSLHIASEYLCQGYGRVLMQQLGLWLEEYFTESGVYFDSVDDLIQRYDYDVIEGVGLPKNFTESSTHMRSSIRHYQWQTLQQFALLSETDNLLCE